VDSDGVSEQFPDAGADSRTGRWPVIAAIRLRVRHQSENSKSEIRNSKFEIRNSKSRI